MPRFGRDVRPILADRCFLCHGPDSAKREAELRLDQFESATSPRGEHPAAIIPGDADASELWRRITSDDPDVMMPPPDSNKRPLSAEERATLRGWIDAGAAYEPHWAFVPPLRPTPPEPSGAPWARNPIDLFVLDGLERAGLTPSPDDDDETLLRRVFLDLTGLPPTPDEVRAYLADTRGDRYERLVDRLMTEEPYRTRHAEHLATPWLDQSRYADTCGIHMDAGRSIWPWRDWVLRALRDNMPFDRFVTEQLAGDLIPGATLDQRIASGFNRNHVTTDEGGVIAEEYLVEYAVDRVSTTGSVFLGLTLGCARCHDHKFDPVSMEDFYGLIAFFNSIEEPGLYSQLPDPTRAFEPFIEAPTPEQAAAVEALRASIEQVRAERDEPDPGEDAQRAAYFAELPVEAGVRWLSPGAGMEITGATSDAGATLTPQPDGSVLASGENPARDVHTITLRTEGTGLRLIALEALTDASLAGGRVGRAPNGNAVLSGVECDVVSLRDPSVRATLEWSWAWADLEQSNGDFRVVNAIDPDPARGWAVDAHNQGGPRLALLLAREEFGFEGGSELVVRLRYGSIYDQHTFGRVRLSASPASESFVAALPLAAGGFYLAGPFMSESRDATFDRVYGPESERAIDLAKSFEGVMWRFDERIREGSAATLSEGLTADYVAWTVRATSARTLTLSMGSDDALRVFRNGEEIFANRVDRSLAPDQDSVQVALSPGENTFVFKVVNTGGPSGIFIRPTEDASITPRAMLAGVLPPIAARDDLRLAASNAWRERHSPRYRDLSAKLAASEDELGALQSAIPRTMVMQELPMPRETFVLSRGQYDQPDHARPVSRAVPAALGRLSDDMPKDRLGLARWLTGAENSLMARVTVNRFWEQLFGHGIVRTSEDFGFQGEWPTHPELLDWLAVEFREGGWDVNAMLRLIVTSSTYRQSSRIRPEAREVDPDNRLLAYFPRQRLSAEQIRDQALYLSNLLVERLGGPSVKPYQPEGLWAEIAMLQSNTRIYEQSTGEGLWRRSLYTYWKRAAPPPSLLTLDAPTREYCNIRRLTTNTPLQALVLWNDVQFVEASRAAAARVLAESSPDDDSRARLLFLLCTGAEPDERELTLVRDAAAAFRERYLAAPEDAASLVRAGMSPVPTDLDPADLAAWTMAANAVMASDACIVKD